MDRILLIVLLLMVGSRLAMASGADCERALVPESKPWVTQQLDRADAQIGAGDWDSAEATLDAAGRFPRSADVSISPRCLGNALAGRLFRAHQRVYLGRAREAEAAGDSRRAVSLFVRAGELDEVRRLTANLSDEASAYRSVLDTLASQADAGPSQSVGGDLPPLPEQRAHYAACAALAAELATQAEAAANRRLAAEGRLMQAPLSDDERMAMQAQQMGEQVMAAFLDGESSGQSMPAEVLRATRSLDELRAAKGLFEVAGSDGGAVSARAVERGERLQAIAGDGALLIDIREQSAQWAVDYFDLGGATERSRAAAALHQQLKTQLAERNANRERQLEAQRDELEAAAEDARRAAAEMGKTEAEKQAFKDEADALEEELGF